MLQSRCMAYMGFGEAAISIRSAELEVRGGKLKNGKAISKDEIIGEMVKGRSDRVVDWIGSGDYVIWPLRVVVCLKTGDLL